MKIIGLSGGVASGKNFVADFFKENGAEIFDADKETHDILQNDKNVISQIEKHFSEAVAEAVIDRKILGKIVFKDKEKLKILEKIIHPIIRKRCHDFFRKAKENNTEIVVLNIPLLLESDAYDPDFIIALVVSKEVQKKRFIERARKNQSEESLEILEERFNQIVKHQISNEERKAKADFVIDTSFSKEKTLEQVKEILKKIS